MENGGSWARGKRDRCGVTPNHLLGWTSIGDVPTRLHSVVTATRPGVWARDGGRGRGGHVEDRTARGQGVSMRWGNKLPLCPRPYLPPQVGCCQLCESKGGDAVGTDRLYGQDSYNLLSNDAPLFFVLGGFLKTAI